MNETETFIYYLGFISFVTVFCGINIVVLYLNF